MRAVMEAELALGRLSQDVSARRGIGDDLDRCGPLTGRLHLIEVRGCHQDADSVTLTRNEIVASRNAPDAFQLVLVQVTPSGASPPRYLSSFPFREPGFAEVASTFKLSDLLAAAREPH